MTVFGGGVVAGAWQYMKRVQGRNVPLTDGVWLHNPETVNVWVVGRLGFRMWASLLSTDHQAARGHQVVIAVYGREVLGACRLTKGTRSSQSDCLSQ